MEQSIDPLALRGIISEAMIRNLDDKGLQALTKKIRSEQDLSGLALTIVANMMDEQMSQPRRTAQLAFLVKLNSMLTR